ncbi:MAG: isochorismatase family protein [Burkholderiales bacterium]|nr:isochorismatase family protein [Burkholderiales bacterium]
MQGSDLTARQMYEALMREPRRRPFGFGTKAALVNVDLQNAYTRTDRYPTAYSNDPRQIEHVNRLAAAQRRLGWPVVWTTLAFLPDGSDCGVWGLRSDTPDSLQRIGFDSDRAQLDERLDVNPDRDVQIIKKMPSAFHGTHLLPYLVAQRVDTVIVTGGSTSGCVRATVVDSLSNGFLTVVSPECVADVHESPHYANLYDMQAKYADLRSVEEVVAWLEQQS